LEQRTIEEIVQSILDSNNYKNSEEIILNLYKELIFIIIKDYFDWWEDSMLPPEWKQGGI